jgi:hypothetical protein
MPDADNVSVRLKKPLSVRSAGAADSLRTDQCVSRDCSKFRKKHEIQPIIRTLENQLLAKTEKRLDGAANSAGA